MVAYHKFKCKSIFKIKGLSVIVKYNLNTNFIAIRKVFRIQKSKQNYTWRKTHKDIIRKLDKQRHCINKTLLHKLKINGCAICGYNKCVNALDFHHVNSTDKKFNITATNLTYSQNSLTDELNKCILLCANCHREIHRRKKNAM